MPLEMKTYKVVKPFPIWVFSGTFFQVTDENRKMKRGPVLKAEVSQVGDIIVEQGPVILGRGDVGMKIVTTDPTVFPIDKRAIHPNLIQEGFLAPENPTTKLELWREAAAELEKTEYPDPVPFVKPQKL